ncbi:MAG TPA: carboxypeptidase-like regulatory domain-containing protein, partial [Vicinamibacterales bacterium]|nr:carboxypeptidase-like regulatory domain-containing protein [Vicinamibacterales bacterium]
ASAGVWAQVPPVPKPAQPPQPGQTRDSQAQTQAPATAVIMGHVLIGGSGQPADGVRLTLSGNELRGSRSTLSDDSGNFAFVALPPGTYTLRATKLGYVSATYGQKQPGRPGTAIVLAVGQQLKGVSLEVPRGGVVSGTVYDEKNRPAVSVPVRLLQWTWQSGERVLTSAGSGTTDDRGIYRIFGLSPGDYVVNATPRNTSSTMYTYEDVQGLARMEELGVKGLAAADMTKQLLLDRDSAMPNSVNNEPVSGYAAVYFPGTPQPGNAQAVKVGVSQEQLGIDFQLQRVPLSRVSGTIMAPSGVSTQNVQVRLIETGAQVPGMSQLSARPTPQGGFTFNAVPPGQYQLSATVTMPINRALVPNVMPQDMQAKVEMEAQMSSGGGRRLWAVADITVDGNSTPNVALTLQEGMTITGAVSFDGTAPQPQLNRVRLTLGPLGQAMQSIGANTITAAADANGRFTFTGISPGHYRIRASGAAGWTVKGVIAEGKDTLDFPLEVKPGENLANVNVEFTDKFTDLKGTIQSQIGQPTADFTVIIFSSDPRYWVPLGRRIRSARPSTDGKFSFNGLPPGDYRIAAVTDVEPGAWNDPALLQELMTQSVAVRLVEGQPIVQDLRVSGGY